MSSRERLLEATKRLLWERGFEATSPRAVMTESGVGQGSLYHHFPTKKDLAHAALEDVSAELTATARRLLIEQDAPPLERLRAWLTAPRNGLKGCRLGRLANERSVFEAELHGPIAAYFRALQGYVTATVTEAIEAGTLPRDLDPEVVAAALIATIQGGYVVSRALDDEQAITRATQGAMEFLDSLARRAAGD